MWLPLAAVGGLLAAVSVAATVSAPQVQFLPERGPLNGGEQPLNSIPPEAPPTPPMGLPQPNAGLTLPAWLGTLLSVLCIGAVVIIIGWVLWYFLRDWLASRKIVPAREPEQAQRLESPLAAVRSALDEGLIDLDDADADPRRAVIACWVRLEQAAAAVGTPRRVGDTSTDLVLRLLGEHQVSAGALDGFAAVYRAARYGQHMVDESMREVARSALRQLRGELTEEAERAVVTESGGEQP
jgi:hypothetical protein